MATLIILATTGKGAWNRIFKLLNVFDWEKVLVITNKFGYEKLEFKESKVEKIEINFNAPYDYVINEIKEKLKNYNLTEVALNISSGEGKEHVALIVALIKLGVSLQFVDLEDNELKIIGND
ncbi:MAG: hypothetical protein QXS41_03830 [Candidatus Woesearchaeota archaeon]